MHAKKCVMQHTSPPVTSAGRSTRQIRVTHPAPAENIECAAHGKIELSAARLLDFVHVVHRRDTAAIAMEILSPSLLHG